VDAIELGPGDVRSQLPAAVGAGAALIDRSQVLADIEDSVPVPGDVPLAGLEAATVRPLAPGPGLVALAFESPASAHAAAADIIRMRCSPEPNPLALPVAGAVGLKDVWHDHPRHADARTFESASAVLWRGRVVEVIVSANADAVIAGVQEAVAG
jgi:hypothetical protein